MIWYYLIIFTATFSLAVLLTALAIKLAWKLKIVDRPDAERKIHGKETPLLGGLAIFLAFFTAVYLARDVLLSGNLAGREAIEH
mgnify:FL=1